MKTLLTTITALLVFGNVSAGEFDMKCKPVKFSSISRRENKEVVCYVLYGDSMSCKFKKEEK